MEPAEFPATAPDEWPQPSAFLSHEARVEESWIDYNGHMTEWQYYKLLAEAGECFLRAAGFTEEYRLRGYSFFSVEGHLRNLKECRVGTPLSVYTDLVGFDAVRLHIYQYVWDKSRSITVATGEHMMLHVDTRKRAVIPMEPYMYDCLVRAAERWRPQLKPLGLGAAIGRRAGVGPASR